MNTFNSLNRPALTMISAVALLFVWNTKTVASEPPVVVQGILHVVKRFGPPGYGETPEQDRVVEYLSIKLAKSVTLPCNRLSPDCDSCSDLQLFFMINSDDAVKFRESLIGRQVVVVGSLHRWNTASEFTPINVDVDSIRAAK